jgi:DNA-directed RNA polymerase subunit B
VCGEKAKISSVVIAYAFKLLLQEMMSLNIAPRLLAKERV